MLMPKQIDTSIPAAGNLRDAIIFEPLIGLQERRCAPELRASNPHKQTWRRPGTRCAMTGLLLLLLSGDVALNPGPGAGPRIWKYPCGTCQKPVKSNQRGLQCDSCGLWSHLNCLPDAIHVTLHEYDKLSSVDENWYCYRCQLPAFSDSFFSITTDDHPGQPQQPQETTCTSNYLEELIQLRRKLSKKHHHRAS